MRNELKKYFIENVGAFATLDEGEFNELVTHDMQMIQVPAMLYVKEGYRYSGDELVLTLKELATLIKTSLTNSIN
jgi:hypothetical protein